MSTYASDLTASLSSALVQLAPSLVPSSPAPPPTPATASGLAPDQLAHTPIQVPNDLERQQDRESQLRRALVQLQPPHASSSSSVSTGASSSAALSSASGSSSSRSHRLHPPKELANLALSLFPTSDHDDDNAFAAPQLTTVEYVVLAQLAIAAYGTILRTLMHQANQLEKSDRYWAAVESTPLETGLYLVQSAPERALSLGMVSLTRFKQLALSAKSKGGARPAILSRETWRKAVPPSLFLTAVFPHLSTSSGLPSLAELSSYDTNTIDSTAALSSSDYTPRTTTSAAAAAATAAPANLARLGRRTARSLLFLTLSPLSLTRAEISHKRRALREQRDQLAIRIGELTLAANAGGAVEPGGEDQVGDAGEEDEKRVTKEDLRKRPGLAQIFGLAAQQGNRRDRATTLSLEDVKQATYQTLLHLESVLSPSTAETEQEGPRRAVHTADALTPRTPAQLAHQLSTLLTDTLSAQQTTFSAASDALAPPGALARAWPYLLSIPLVGGIVARTVYNNRASLRLWAQETVSTVRGFLIDWVVEPVRHILETLRGGEEGGIALMGRESLKSDLASLERMVVDFARDEYKLGPEELQVLAEQVRAGDLTPVLRVWEEDIKSPIKSAVRGSLVRTLLIQVQKVKVDVALAMDGIEKMLKSQQLTFGFVGVAPSMLILALVGRWAKGLVRSDGSRRKRGEEKRRCWMVIRDLDLLLSPTRARAGPSSRPSSAKRISSRSDDYNQTTAAALTQGHLLLSLSSLRSFAHSSHFPSRDTQLRTAFLEDVRAVEDGATQAGTEERRALVRRLERWSDALGWNECVRS
ncbi:hypothetical protein JCM10908_004322 [Rhodotorula pacifica]|uniref:Nca2p n=1 Tax=Rhodotorula pacifica TaxID=1495444 RepID=UPI00316B3047